MAKKASDAKLYAIIGLVLNLFFPGVGTVIWGNRKHGIWQIVLWVVSIPLTLVLLGFVTYAIAWIWALVSGIQMVMNA